MREVPVCGDQLGAVLLEGLAVGAVRSKSLPRKHEVGDRTDQILDRRSIRMEPRRSRGPQRHAHVPSVIGVNQEMVKHEKTFSELSLS